MIAVYRQRMKAERHYQIYALQIIIVAWKKVAEQQRFNRLERERQALDRRKYKASKFVLALKKGERRSGSGSGMKTKCIPN